MIDQLTNHQHIVLLGLPASGKTTLAAVLHKLLPQHVIVHTDDYIKYGFENSLYELIDDLKYWSGQKLIVEGVQGYRLMRKLAQQKHKGVKLLFNPTQIVIATRSKENREATAEVRGKVSYSPMDKTLMTIWNDYKAVAKEISWTVEELVINMDNFDIKSLEKI